MVLSNKELTSSVNKSFVSVSNAVRNRKKMKYLNNRAYNSILYINYRFKKEKEAMEAYLEATTAEQAVKAAKDLTATELLIAQNVANSSSARTNAKAIVASAKTTANNEYVKLENARLKLIAADKIAKTKKSNKVKTTVGDPAVGSTLATGLMADGASNKNFSHLIY